MKRLFVSLNIPKKLSQEKDMSGLAVMLLLLFFANPGVLLY